VSKLFSLVQSSPVAFRPKKIPVVPVPTRPYFFLPTLLFFQALFLRAAHTACQNGACCHTNYWTKLPKFVHRKYASLVNIDVGTLLQITQQKNAKTMKKIFEKKCISDLPTLIFSRYETGNTGIFLGLSIYSCTGDDNKFQWKIFVGIHYSLSDDILSCAPAIVSPIARCVKYLTKIFKLLIKLFN
jgi:hypothetical protein